MDSEEVGELRLDSLNLAHAFVDGFIVASNLAVVLTTQDIFENPGGGHVQETTRRGRDEDDYAKKSDDASGAPQLWHCARKGGNGRRPFSRPWPFDARAACCRGIGNQGCLLGALCDAIMAMLLVGR